VAITHVSTRERRGLPAYLEEPIAAARQAVADSDKSQRSESGFDLATRREVRKLRDALRALTDGLERLGQDVAAQRDTSGRDAATGT
jgi:hypothetical protein